MSMKRVALLLGCIGSSMMAASPGFSAGRAAAGSSALWTRGGESGSDAPFDLTAPLPGKSPAGSMAGGSLLSNGSPGVGSPAVKPAAGASRNERSAKVDESALRFYASQNDAARVSMEVKRLKALNPSWEPPSDLFDEARDPAVEQKLWDLFAAGRLDEIRLAVNDIRSTDPTWQPSDKFVREFERAEARLQLVAASDAKDAAGVLAVAEAHPDMVACSDVDVMWRVGEALVGTGDADRAQELYKYVLARCPNPAERVATVQKAMDLLPPKVVKVLIALGQRRSSNPAEYESVRLDLVRRQIGAMASGAASEPLPAEEFQSFEGLIKQRKLAADAALLGWYHYSRKDWAVAAQWFKQAMDWERLPKAAEGYALALRQQGLTSDAETVAYQWREASPLIAKLFVEIAATSLTQPHPAAVDPDRLARVEEVVEATQSANGAQALGWYYYNTDAFPKAQPWFTKAVAWDANEKNVLGLALAAHRSKDLAEFRKTLAEYRGRYPAIAALETYDRTGSSRRGAGKVRGSSEAGRLAEAAVAQFKSGQYREALDTLNKRAKVGREDEGLGVLRGWALYQLMQYDKARDQFAELDKKHSTRDTQYGLYYAGSRLDPLNLGD